MTPQGTRVLRQEQRHAPRAMPGGHPSRNGLTAVPYAYRARTYRWAERALAASIARHGNPDDVPDYDDIALLDDLLAMGYARPVRPDEEAGQ